MTGCILITGGAGFIGTNLARRLAGAGRTVRILDALVRQGAQQNVIDACNSFQDASSSSRVMCATLLSYELQSTGSSTFTTLRRRSP